MVGTHRLLQKDVVFKDLGLIVVDEEQRFGVMHKERLKELRASRRRAHAFGDADPAHPADVAAGRSRSVPDPNPARNRLSIKTIVIPQSDAIDAESDHTELDRGGQVYYLHNRVETIHAVSRALKNWCRKPGSGSDTVR